MALKCPSDWKARRSMTAPRLAAGLHICAGMKLARMEMEALLEALVQRVGRITRRFEDQERLALCQNERRSEGRRPSSGQWRMDLRFRR